jgi:hypothetical protein
MLVTPRRPSAMWKRQRDLRSMRVHTRCLRKQGGAWEGWAVWPGALPGEKRTYYEVARTS